MKKITAAEWVKRYEMTNAAEKTAIVYTLEKRVYMSLVDSLIDFPVEIHQRVKDEGIEFEFLRLNLKQKDLLRLRDNGAVLLGWHNEFFADLQKGETRGHLVERKVIERYHGIASEASTPYYKAGDAIIAGIQVQIKYQDGTLSTLETIRKAWNNKKRRG